MLLTECIYFLVICIKNDFPQYFLTQFHLLYCISVQYVNK